MIDLHHRATLAYSMMAALAVVGPRYGVELRGLDDDANEHSDFWQEVAAEILNEPAVRSPEDT